MSRTKIRVLCVDDHLLVREGITRIIALQPDMKVVATAATGDEAVEQFRCTQPDVTLMDLQLPGMNGLDAITAIRAEFPSARIVVLTMYHGEEDIYRALRAGATGYLLKDALSKDLLRTIRQAHAGERPLPPKVAAQLELRKTQATLSLREEQVIELVAKGLRNKEIANSLGIAEDTVQVYIKSIFSKLNVHDRISAISVAAKRGIIRLG